MVLAWPPALPACLCLWRFPHTHRPPSPCILRVPHQLLCILSPHSPILNICSLSRAHISEACLPMSPFLRFYPAFILFPCPCLSPSATLYPYTHLSLVVGSQRALITPLHGGPFSFLQQRPGESISPACSAAVPFPRTHTSSLSPQLLGLEAPPSRYHHHPKRSLKLGSSLPPGSPPGLLSCE